MAVRAAEGRLHGGRWVLRRGWPAFAGVVLLPKQLELGRAARLVERVIFLGAMAGFIYYGGLQPPRCQLLT